MITAVIDCGSNAVRMVISDISNGKIKEIIRFRENVRLSENMSDDCVLKPEPVQRTLAAMAEFRKMIDKYKAETVVAVATAAMRNAKNPEVLTVPLKELGIALEIIDGEREAYYDYMGVISTNKVTDCVILDIGGASSELILVKNRKNCNAVSLPFGAVSLTEQYITDYDMPGCQRRAEEFVRQQLSGVDFLNAAAGLDIVALGGTARAIGSIDLKTDDVENGHTVTSARAREIMDSVNIMTLDEIKKKVTMEKKRADIIKGGFVPLLCLIEQVGAKNVIVSRSGVREGILYELAR